VDDVGARFPHRVTYHDSCHLLRELGVSEPPRQLLRKCKALNWWRWAITSFAADLVARFL